MPVNDIERKPALSGQVESSNPVIGVVGLGRVGLVTAAGLCKLGFPVIGIDSDKARTALILEGRAPFEEPSLGDLLKDALSNKMLTLETAYQTLFTKSSFIFVCLPSPSGDNNELDMSAVLDFASAHRQEFRPNTVLAIKSTVAPGTMSLVSKIIDRPDVSIIYNPEFLSEGSSVEDFFKPDRLVVGGTSVEAIEKFSSINSQLNADTTIMSWGAAEILKLASNAFLATRVTLVNEIEEICRKQGVSFKHVAEGLSKDKRIGAAYLAPGPGWGGSCLPKDVAGLVQHSKAAGNSAILLEAVIRSNRERILGVVDLVESHLKSYGAPLRIAILGRAFKSGTDDIRESPALAIAKEFVKRGHRVNSFDPVAEAIEIEGMQCTASAIDAINGSDAIVVATEWPEFRLISPEIAIGKMNQDLVVDTRSILDLASWSNHTKNIISFG